MGVPSSLRRTALGNSPLGRALRWLYWAPSKASLPVPGWFAKPFLWLFLFLRTLWHSFLRIFIAEPFFRAYCTRYGRRLRTGPFVHWIRGPGQIIVGDDVLVDGKCSIKFAWRFEERPTLRIGSRTGIGHACS